MSGEAQEITFRSDFAVDLVDSMGGDDSVLRAMLVSTFSDGKVEGMGDDARRGRIRYMMRSRHGSVFEHNGMTFRSEAPIFVYREWHRHRIGVSVNESSGRYSELPPVFYVPPSHRPLVQKGKPGAYEYVPGSDAQHSRTVAGIENICRRAYGEYQELLGTGIAKEVARMVLPVNIYSSMYWTCNARSLMAFLSLRTRDDRATYPSTPMWEIEASARAMEAVFSEAFPLTYEAFCDFGRVAP